MRYGLILRRFVVLAIACLAVITLTSAYEYSVTVIEEYSNLEDLDPFGVECYQKVSYWLGVRAGWSEQFYERDWDVTQEDLGTDDSGYQGLDEVDFHYHFGHGISWLGGYGHTELALSGWNPGYLYDVRPDEVADKWGDMDNDGCSCTVVTSSRSGVG